MCSSADAQGAGLIAVDHDFKLGSAAGKELADQAVGVAQFGNAGLGDQVDLWASLKSAVPVKSSREPISTTTLSNSCARDGDQPVDGLVGGLELGKFPRSREHGNAGTVLDQELGEKARIQPAGF